MAASKYGTIATTHLDFYESRLSSGEFSNILGDEVLTSDSHESLVSRHRPKSPRNDVIVSFGRERGHLFNRKRHCFVKTDRILRVAARFAYGLVPCWPARFTRCHITVSVILAILQLLAFCEYIYVVKKYWTSSHSPLTNSTTNSTMSTNVTNLTTLTTNRPINPSIPAVTLIMEIGLFISGIISFILACRFFYADNQNFQRSHCELIPYVKFITADEEVLDIGPTPNDWLLTNAFLLVATLDIFFVILVDFQWEAYFDFYGIHDFLKHVNLQTRILYYAYICFFNWSMACAVVSCCVFHILTRDIIQHIEFTERQIIERSESYIQARELHEELLNYREKLIVKFQLWFTTHNLLFFFILLCMIFDWFEATKNSEKVEEHPQLWASQLLASLLIAFKFSFPFLSASRVTARFEKMYYLINRQKIYQNIQDLSKFLDYAERCNYGFVIFGFKITTNVALITIFTTFVGIFKFLAD